MAIDTIQGERSVCWHFCQSEVSDSTPRSVRVIKHLWRDKEKRLDLLFIFLTIACFTALMISFWVTGQPFAIAHKVSATLIFGFSLMIIPVCFALEKTCRIGQVILELSKRPETAVSGQ